MQTVSEKLEAAAKGAFERSIGEKKGGCALLSREGKVYSGFYAALGNDCIIYPVDMALSLALGDKAAKFTAAFLCGEALNASSLRRLARFGDLLINGEKDGKKFTSTLKKLVIAAGEK